MKKLFLGLVLMAGMAFSQVKVCHVEGAPTAGILAANGTDISLFAASGTFDDQCNFVPNVTQSVFDPAYWSHFPAEIQALRTDTNAFLDAQKLSANPTLAVLLDKPIMVDHDDPWLTMYLRIQFGYTWIPNATQPNIVAGPGISFPGFPLYDPKNPPAGSIKVSLSLADFPSLVKPVPAPVPSTDPIGVPMGGPFYATGKGFSATTYPNGALYVDSRGTFLSNCGTSSVAMPNPWCYWSKVK